MATKHYGQGQCCKCGAWVPLHYLTQIPGKKVSVCESCRIDSWIPAWYPQAEEYVFVAAFKHSNATKKPASGVDLIDDSPRRLVESA